MSKSWSKPHAEHVSWYFSKKKFGKLVCHDTLVGHHCIIILNFFIAVFKVFRDGVVYFLRNAKIQVFFLLPPFFLKQHVRIIDRNKLSVKLSKSYVITEWPLLDAANKISRCKIVNFSAKQIILKDKIYIKKYIK